MRSPVRVTVRMALGLGVLVAAAGCDPAEPLTWDADQPCEGFVQVDLRGLDVRCDGPDGPFSDVVFVSPEGRAGARGTLDDPVSLPELAVQRARREGRRWVLLAAGEYEGRVTLVDGVSLAGGYDPETWQRPQGLETRLTASRSPVVVARDLTQLTRVVDVHVHAPDAEEPSASSIALHVVNSGDALLWRRGSLNAGRGADGQEPASFDDPAPSGEDGQGKVSVCTWLPHQSRPPCANEHDMPIGEAVDCPIGGRTGAGGRAGKANWHRTNPALVPRGNGFSGASASTGAAGGEGGEGSDPVIFMRINPTCQADRGQVATNGARGERGEDGEPGAPGDPHGTLDEDGLWIPRHGHDGAHGTHGGGGGGGGGGPAIFDEDRCTTWTPFGLYAPGGSGASGGCGGQGGEGGGSGGASIAAVVVRSRPVFQDTTLTTDAGGRGAEGGVGQEGGSGGTGGIRTFNRTYDWIHSGWGGGGGRGGQGGPGGDGAGGSSIALVVSEGEVLLDEVEIRLGVAGGSPSGSDAPAGLRQEVLTLEPPR